MSVSPVAYLRAAQAYMLISMPTGTSTIFGVCDQFIANSGIKKESRHSPSSGVESGQLKVSMNSQIIYSGDSGLSTAGIGTGLLQRTTMSLIGF